MTWWHYDINSMVKEDHPLRAISKAVSFEAMTYRIKDVASDVGRKGYGVDVGLKCLFLQFQYDLSDREMEERLRYDIAFRWFCGFELGTETPDHSYFGRMRKAIGASRIGKLFNWMNKKLEESGIMGTLFTFADASIIIAKETTWTERDKALANGERGLNNQNMSKYLADTDARFGCKGSEYWCGYKRNTSCDMKSGLIKKVAVTPGNITDQAAFALVCPKNSIVFGDKAFCLKPAQDAMKANGCESAAILKNNMKDKNFDLDRWKTKVRAPFESTFSKQKDKTRYRRLAKVQLQAFMQALVFNIRRLVVIAPPNYCLS